MALTGAGAAARLSTSAGGSTMPYSGLPVILEARSKKRSLRPAHLASERLKRQIDGLLDEVEAAVSQLDWLVVRDRTQAVLALDPENADAATFLAAAERALNPSVSILQPLSSIVVDGQTRASKGEVGRVRVVISRRVGRV